MIRAKRKQKLGIKKDHAKETVFKALSGLLDSNGYQVRREKLKTGPGWRVLSGECRHNADNIIFVDSVMDQDDQIEFLAGKIQEFGVIIPEEIKETLPAYLR